MNGMMQQAMQNARAIRPEHAAAGGNVTLLPDYLGVARKVFDQVGLADGCPQQQCCIADDHSGCILGLCADHQTHPPSNSGQSKL